MLHNAAIQAHAPAAYELASRYYFGQSLKQDRRVARLWAREAAHHDSSLISSRDSIFEIGAIDQKDETALKQWANWSPRSERKSFIESNCAGIID
jgi:TPR repeat protein